MIFLLSILAGLFPLGACYAWAVSSFPRMAGIRFRLLFATGLFSLSGPPLQWVVVHTHWRAASFGLAFLVGVVVVLALASVPLALLRTAIWILSRGDEKPAPVGALSASAESETAAASSLSRRQTVEAATGAAFLAVAGTALGWGIVRGRHAFELHEVVVRIAGLPRVLDGYVIAQVSDIHAGDLVDELMLDEGLALVRRIRPDLIAATGDLVDIDPNFARLIGRKLADLPARDGVVAVLGNHDYYAGADLVASALRFAGVDLLVNAARVVRAGDGGGFAVLGVDDLGSTRFGRSGPLIDRALSQSPPDLARILLSHQPPTVDRWAGKVDLQLSGHTHGGQVNPGGRLITPLFEYIAGSYVVGSTTLYVNRGFGTVGPPARIGVPPEVTRVVLVAG